MQPSNFEIVENIGNQQDFMDSSYSCSSVSPIFNPQKPNHHHFQQHLHQQNPQPYNHISHLVHPIPLDLFQRQHQHQHHLQLQALQQQEEQQGRLHWQPPSPVNFKLGLNENRTDARHNLGFKSWQTQDDYGIRKEPMCWKPLDVQIPDTNKKQKQVDEGERCKELEGKYRLYGELEAIYSLAKMGAANHQTGSGSALTGENSPRNVDLPVPVNEDPHGQNVGPTPKVRGDNVVDNVSESDTSIGEEVSLRKIQKKKRKRKVKEELSSMTRFFESMVKQVMDHQDNLHKKYLEVIERIDNKRREREAAWRCQEAENHKREAISKLNEQAQSSRREALIVSYIEKITGQRFCLPARQIPLLLQSDSLNETGEELTPFKGDHANSRWPQSEVEALILLRSSIESKFQEPGAKGPVWEEVSALMASMGYQRSARRCKEKWENINKYFRKTKDSGKKRPHPSKTCSYFNQLDQLYSRTPITVPSSSGSYCSPTPSVSMDVGIQRQGGYSELLESFIAGSEAGVAHNLSNGNFEISEMGSNKLDFEGIAEGKVEHVHEDHGKEKEIHEGDVNMDENKEIDGDDSDE